MGDYSMVYLLDENPPHSQPIADSRLWTPLDRSMTLNLRLTFMKGKYPDSL